MPSEPNKAHFKQYKVVNLILVLGIFFLSGCVLLSDPESSQVYQNDVVGIVDPSNTLEQVFTIRQSRIDNLVLWLKTSPQSGSQTGNITFDLYNPADATSPWASTSIQTPAIQSVQAVSINFTQAVEAPSYTFRLVIRSTDSTIQVMGRGDDGYSNGYAIQNGIPIPGDIAFRTSYSYGFENFLSDVHSWVRQGYLIITFFIILFVPGHLFLSVSKIDKFFTKAEILAISIALSLAIPVVVMEWTTWLDFRWTKDWVRFIYGVTTLVYVLWIGNRFLIQLKTYRLCQNQYHTLVSNILGWFFKNWILLTLFLVFLFSLAIRLIMIRDLTAPPWVDSVHHALLTRIIMEQGKYPDTYSPYITADNTRYHPGYHAMLAAFQWLSNLELHTGMLIFGQVLNAAIVLAMFLFAKTITQNSRVSLIAALFAGVFTPMPAYYTSWGRYTQLVGLLILPAAFAMIRLISSSPKPKLENKYQLFIALLISGLLCTGLFITHYRVIVFLGLILISYASIKLVLAIKNHTARLFMKAEVMPLLMIIVVSIILSGPWLPGALKELIIPKIASSVKGDTGFAGHSWAYLTSASGTWTLYLAAAGILLGLLKRKIFPWVLLLWVAFLFFMSNLNMLSLPMGGLINNTSVEIMLFMPIAVLGGYFVNNIIDWFSKLFNRRWRLLYYSIIAIACIGVSFNAAQRLLPILNPDTDLVRQADIPAIEWIENNIPADETIFINPYPWGYGLFTGADGGFWITPLSGRKTVPPPLLYGFDTQGDVSRHFSEFGKTASELCNDPVALYNLLLSEKIHYVYLGAKGGILSPTRLINSRLFNPIYSKDGIWIFTLPR